MPPSHPTGRRWPGLLACLSLWSGCATQGPNHVYYTQAGGSEVHDRGPALAEIAGAVTPDEQVLGLAYDFNTDHLFLRIAPAQVIRVVERPSGKVLREMPLPADLHAARSADLAVRSSDRHLFAAHPDGHAVIELTLFGEFVRRIELPGGTIGGLAFDQRNGHLLVLSAQTVRRFSPDGKLLAEVTLQGSLASISLGYDSEAQHSFVPLADGHTLGEFDATGKLLATHTLDGNASLTALDAGQRSLVRVF